MHNSQDGTQVFKAGSQEVLLNTAVGSSCWGCHATSSGSNIDPLTGAPQVRHNDASDLSGGNFAYITGAHHTLASMLKFGSIDQNAQGS